MNGIIMERRIMPGIVVVAAISLAALSCSRERPEASVDARIARVERSLVEFTTPLAAIDPEGVDPLQLKTLPERMEHFKVPGLDVAVIDDYELAWARPYGLLKAGGTEPVTNDSYFQAASTSKLITAAIVMHLVDEGLLNLDHDINDYLHSWEIPGNEFTRQQKVTLRLLLTHQAGLPSTSFPTEEGAGEPTLVEILNGQLPAMNKPAIVEYVPGTKWQYSNLGFVVIQQVLEDILDMPFPQIAREILFNPLGMEHSTFAYPLEPDRGAEEAMPHDAEGNAAEPALSPSASAHGGLITTPSDLALFAIELMMAYEGSSNKLLSQAAARHMFTKQIDIDPAILGVPLGQGLGTLLYEMDGGLVFLHPGSNLPGTTCWLSGQIQTGKGIVIMTNAAMGEVLALEIVPAIEIEYDWISVPE
jgi:CubicO group peptidase (beta-lactamase class C family)